MNVPLANLVGSRGLLGGDAYFLHWGVVQISLANLIVIVLMVILFVLAVVLQFRRSDPPDEAPGDADVRR